MMANPIIKALSITINSATGEVYQQRLYQNIGAYGWARGRTVKKDGITIFQNSVCINPISGLSIRGYSLIVPAPSIVVGELVDHIMFGCNSAAEQNCISSPVTCTNPVESSRLTDIAVIEYNPATPFAPSNLIATPGDTIADISFSSAAPGNSSDGARIFAYHVVITDPSGVTIINGYLTSTETSIRIGNLTNGVTYNVAITAFTVSGMTGTRAMTTVTPAGVLPILSRIVLPNTVSMVVNDTGTLLPYCYDTNGTLINCESLVLWSWTSSNPNIATVTPASNGGSVTGISTGTTNIIAFYGGVTSNVCTANIQPPAQCPTPVCSIII